MALRPIEGGACIPVAIIRDETAGTGGGGLSVVSDPALLAELQKKADLTEAQPVVPAYKTVTAADCAAPADNTAAEVSYSAVSGVCHVIGQVTWSYDADPTGGALSITSGADTLFTILITKGGPGQLTFSPPITAGAGKALKVSLAAAGGTVQGTVSVTHWTEA